MEATILKLLDINKQFVEDSKSPKLSDKIVAHYYTLSEPAKQLHFKDALIQQLYSFSTVNYFTNFAHLLYAALAIKPPNLDGVLYKFLINQKQLNQTFEGHNPNQLCLKILSQIPVNPIYVNNINQFFKNKVDESIGLHLFHFYAVNHLSNESLSVLSSICDNNLYEGNPAVLSFQLFTSLKYVEPEIFEVWLDTKLEEKQIPEYVLKVLRKTFERVEKNYPENWKQNLNKFFNDVELYLLYLKEKKCENRELVRGQTIPIAIAEDSQLFAQALITLLQQHGAIDVLFTAHNGSTLLHQLKQSKPKVILMDIRMPDIDGLEATNKVKELYPEIYVIILSVYDDISIVKNALKAGADGYLLKDIDVEELQTAIEKVAAGETYFCKRVQDILKIKKTKFRQ